MGVGDGVDVGVAATVAVAVGESTGDVAVDVGVEVAKLAAGVEVALPPHAVARARIAVTAGKTTFLLNITSLPLSQRSSPHSTSLYDRTRI